jgi:hypothetical protein
MTGIGKYTSGTIASCYRWNKYPVIAGIGAGSSTFLIDKEIDAGHIAVIERADEFISLETEFLLGKALDIRCDPI